MVEKERFVGYWAWGDRLSVELNLIDMRVYVFVARIFDPALSDDERIVARIEIPRDAAFHFAQAILSDRGMRS